ncbi:MAG: phosphopantetheine-binding protein, partial [Polyangiaceae bacterium]|nr:phosphopantetheine-binding protein [Polyangiaceae bacterium]
GGEAPDGGRLRAALAEALPDYLVPQAIVALAALPLTAHGKLDRKALPPPTFALEEAGDTSPRSPVEASLCAIWVEVLGAERVGIHDNFFDVGGHSLAAVRLLLRVRQELGVELPLRALFEAPTVAQLAEVVTAAGLEQMSDEDLQALLDAAED